MKHNILCIFFFTGSSSEEESGEEEESGTGTEQEGSGDTASEPGSQHTTPDNVSGEEIEHGEIVSTVVLARSVVRNGVPVRDADDVSFSIT